MSFHFRSQRLHDVAERKLVDVDNFLLNLGQVDRVRVSANAAATLTPSISDIQHAVLFRPALRTLKIWRHYESRGSMRIFRVFIMTSQRSLHAADIKRSSAAR